jgi:mycofactocin precursor
MTQVDNALIDTEAETEADEDAETEDVLVEEISIDGMCGVY